MKGLNLSGFFTSLLLVGVFNCYAQDYKPFIEPHKYWDVVVTGAMEICTNYSSYDRYFFIGDTIINDLRYSKLAYHPMIDSPDAPPGCVLLGFSRDTFYVNHFFIREDTVAQQVYRYDTNEYNEDEDPSEVLIYDFSLEVGDTLPDYCGGADLVISAIERVTDKFGVERRAYHSWGFDEFFPLLEGLGVGSVFLRGIGGCIRPDGGEGYCYYYDSLQGPNPCYGFITPTENIVQSEIKIYPNPATEFLRVENAPKDFQVEVYDLTGKLLIEQSAKNDRAINLIELTSGVLIVRVVDLDRRVVFIDKVLKE